MKKPQVRRREILEQMAGIERMERGHLSEEYRGDGQASGQLGPYFKHQVWEGGSNRSQRVPSEEVAALRKAIEGYECFERLAGEYVDLTVAMTREERGDLDSKKNARRWKGHAIRRRRRS